jgi:hypothetical protein
MVEGWTDAAGVAKARCGRRSERGPAMESGVASVSMGCFDERDEAIVVWVVGENGVVWSSPLRGSAEALTGAEALAGRPCCPQGHEERRMRSQSSREGILTVRNIAQARWVEELGWVRSVDRRLSAGRRERLACGHAQKREQSSRKRQWQVPMHRSQAEGAYR